MGGDLASEYSPAQMQKLMLSPGERRLDSVRNFVVNSIACQLVLSRKARLMQLLKDLRYDITVQPLPGLGKLPMVIFNVQLALIGFVPSCRRSAPHRRPSFRRASIHRADRHGRLE
jgi:hypothetical protein